MLLVHTCDAARRKPSNTVPPSLTKFLTCANLLVDDESSQPDEPDSMSALEEDVALVVGGFFLLVEEVVLVLCIESGGATIARGGSVGSETPIFPVVYQNGFDTEPVQVFVSVARSISWWARSTELN